MSLNELVGWYQNKIGKYDRNKWEEFMEHKTINGLGVHLKPTKQKAQLIDVDLVRGSSYKAKPKQTLFMVIWLAILRLLFLPRYCKWWTQQTSRNIYKFLITLYILQVFNLGIYVYITSYCDTEDNIVSLRDIIIPNLLSLLLCIIHSQIVATVCSKSRGRPQVSLQAKKRKQRQGVHAKKPNRIPDEKVVEQEEEINLNAFSIHRSHSTRCPNGLRNRNTNWNHIYSPYWINKQQADKLEKEQNPNCDETMVPSERSDVDHGFESLNGKSSSSEELMATSNHGNGTSSQHLGIPTGDQYFDFKRKLICSVNDKDVDDENCNSPESPIIRQFNKVFTSPWLGITSNSECSYSSGSESDSTDKSLNDRDCNFPPTQTLKPGTNDKISCTLWQGNQMTKVEMSVFDISSVITNKVENMANSCDYIYVGIVLSVLLAWVPVFCRLCEAAIHTTNEFNIQNIPTILLEKASVSGVSIIRTAFGGTISEILLLSIGLILRFCLTFMLFFMLAVAERTFKERLLYAKLFSHLTSSRRAKKSSVPHFRLSKLRNIKTWLSVRSYLKKRGPQRSVDVIVSSTMILSIVFVSFLCAESLNDSIQQNWQYDLEVFIWSCCLGCFILRLMTLGTAINVKYRSVSILITEQINLYLKMEQNSEKKQKLAAANSVLKLAADLLKEIEPPFKISGFNINPYLSAAIRVLVVSALSGVCSEMLGFKLKLFKLKET